MGNKMNPEVKEKWIAALESGEYEQGTQALCLDGRFCCLGVLTDLAVKEGVCEWTPEGVDGFLGVVGAFGEIEFSYTPRVVKEWSGLLNPNPYVDVPEELSARLWPGENVLRLSTLNDGGATFAEIADIIREQL